MNTNPAQQADTIRMDVNLIVLQATVTDEQGQLLAKLPKSAFQLSVDGLPRPISVFQTDDAPVAAGILVDNSASMAAKGSEVLAAALEFARESNSQDQMFVVHFSDHAALAMPLEKPFTSSTGELESALSRFKATGTTSLYDAIELGVNHLRTATLDRKVLLIVSDGGDNSSTARLPDVVRLAERTGVIIYCVGIYDSSDRDRNPRVLSQIAELTGGKAFFPAELKEVRKACLEIAHDIRRQYTLGFAGEQDGQYHTIKLVAEDPEYGPLQVHTRAGYFAPKP
jgi:VWFA-related protein